MRAPGPPFGRAVIAVALSLFVLALSAQGAPGRHRAHKSASAPVGPALGVGRPAFPVVLSKPPPLGGTTPSGRDGLDAVVSAGVNVFKIGPASGSWTTRRISDAEAWDKAAVSRGVYTWVDLSTLSRTAPHSSQEALLRKVVTSLESDPYGDGVGMWKGADEPWWSRFSPSSLRFAYCLVTGRGARSWCAGEQPIDGTHPWVTIEAPRGSASELARYSDVTDTHGVDVYPVALGVADPDLHRVGVWTHLIASITPSHSVWTTLQVCFHGSHGSSGRYVLPSRLQERYMIYDAIVNGARGLNFFGGNVPGCWNAGDRALGWNWTFWTSTLARLVEEIGSRSEIASALADWSSTRRLTTSDSTTEAISRRDTGGHLWIIADRGGSGTANVTISGLPAWAGRGTVYTEGRSITARDGSFADRFSQWAVHVYEFSFSPRLPHPHP